ncbi:MAG: hypothetical protein QOK37_1754 [Thermoanaerobaculia bacterium]|jgi:hypothetical protein|nr:hypothetical protein [Thermoanaerobaculia bacterium]
MKSARVVSFAAAVLLSASMLAADDACPCVPLSHLWVVKTCHDWNCASTELLLGNGDPQIFAVPIGMEDGRWLVVRRVAAGAAITDPAEPFQIEQFDGMNDGAGRFRTIPRDGKPVLLTTPDGRVLVLSLKAAGARRHATAH